MVTIFKNLQTILVALGDVVFFGQKMSFETLVSILLMVCKRLALGSVLDLRSYALFPPAIRICCGWTL